MKSLLLKIGLNRSIFLTIINRVVSAFGNIFVIFFISRFLTKPEQGYYYTFGSLAALQVFFELGLSVVITQFVAHEFAFLKVGSDNKQISGPDSHVFRLSSLLRFTSKWYLASASILIVFVLPAGFIFFRNFAHTHEDVNWELPWVLLAIFTALNLLISFYVPFLEGLNKVEEVAKVRMVQSIAGLLALCIALRFHFGLYSVGIVSAVNFIVVSGWMITNKFKSLFTYIWIKSSKAVAISWKNEILPLQWKIALSWLSGYFIFQIFNPIIFAFEGPIVAGQLGITLTAFNGLAVIAMAWINTKIPTFSMQIAKRDYESLDNLFFLTLKQSAGIIIFIVVSFVIALYILQHNFPGWQIGTRFLHVKAALVLGVSTILNQVIYSLATYLRCHKEEPLLIPSLFGGVLTLICSYFFAKWYGVFGMISVNCFNTFLFGLIWVIIIFVNKRRAWHQA